MLRQTGSTCPLPPLQVGVFLWTGATSLLTIASRKHFTVDIVVAW